MSRMSRSTMKTFILLAGLAGVLVLAITQWLLDQLAPAELRGVLAHEIALIANRDILTGAVTAFIATGIGSVAAMAAFNAKPGGGGDDDSPGPAATLALAMVAPPAAGLTQFAVSRSRGHEAGRRGALLLGGGAPLAAALVRIGAPARQTPMGIHPAQSSPHIVNPLAGQAAPLAALFRVHPPTDQRVARLPHTPVRAR